MGPEKIAKQMVDKFSEAGVRRIYGIVGDSLNPVSDALRKAGNIEFVHVRHEESAAFAASAEAQLTENIAVCAGSSGPGNLHLINGLYDAYRSYAPVLAIASHIPSAQIGTGYFQETHPEKIFGECANAYCELLSNAHQTPRTFQNALQSAVSKRGVSVVVLPGDIGDLPAPKTEFSRNTVSPKVSHAPDGALLKKLSDAVNAAAKITVFCGDGCRHAHRQVVDFATKIKAPVGCTLRGKQWLGADNPNYVGLTGLIGYGGLTNAIKNCDLLLVLGADFPYPQWLNPAPKIAQVDIRAEHLGRKSRVDIGLCSDVALALEALMPSVFEKRNSGHLDAALAETKRAREDLAVYIKNVSCQTLPHPEYAAYLIDKYASDSAVFVLPTGLGTVWGARYVTPKSGRRIIGSFTHGSMGNEIGMSIGAQCAFASRQVVSICGDGSLSMMLGELLTVAQYKLPLKMFVFNNGSLGFIDLEMLAAGYQPYMTGLRNPNFADMAKVFGFKGIRVEDSCRLEDAVKQAFAEEGAVLVDITTNPHAIALPPKIDFSQAANFSAALGKLALSGNIRRAVDIITSNDKTLGTLI